MSTGYEYNLGLRFQKIAEKFADRPALCFNKNTCLSYRELNRKANQTARWLLEQNINHRAVLCISGTKTISAYLSILASLKIGATYVVLDPESPLERLRKIINTCQPDAILGEGEFLNRLRKVIDDKKFIFLEGYREEMSEILDRYSSDNLNQTSSVTGEDLAYIMYTSGSTGFPKGAAMTHANVLNLVHWARNKYQILPEDVQTNVNPLYFDNSVFDVYSSLMNGSSLVPFSKEEVQNPKLLVEKVDAYACTLWFSVPSLLIFLQNMKAAQGKYLRSVKRFIFGGEGYPKAKLKQLFDVYHDHAEFHNVYGPTECTCICSSYKLSDSDFEDMQGIMPLGFIAENFNYLILDQNESLLPAGEYGELCLSGPNVGKGYYNDPERTSSSFVQNPINSSYRELIYKTGDLVCLNPVDSKLYIQGRIDNQIKHMGYRIELEEIESALYRLAYVAEACAIHSTVKGLSKLAAAVVLNKEVDDENIRQDLRQIIPDYMIPSHYYRKSVLPKNANGKVDRKYLVETCFQKEG